VAVNVVMDWRAVMNAARFFFTATEGNFRVGQ